MSKRSSYPVQEPYPGSPEYWANIESRGIGANAALEKPNEAIGAVNG